MSYGRPHVSEILNEQELADLIANRLINVAKHPDYNLWIHNYSAAASYTFKQPANWPNAALQCRGLILDSEGCIVARPFKKFFNAEQHPRSDLMWSKPFQVTDKMDGSLGILYPVDYNPDIKVKGRPRQYAIATRGSFTSDQAIRATKILDNKYGDIVHGIDGLDTYALLEDGERHWVTPLFEIIYPQNRIVIDYKGTEDLVLLGVVDNHTGLDVPIPPNQPWPVVKSYDVSVKPREVISHLALPTDGSAEGVVLRFDYPKGQQTRVKLKIEEYCRLHAIVTGVSNKTVWQYLKEDKSFAELLDRVPDEFNLWLEKTKSELETQFKLLEAQIQYEFYEVYLAIQGDLSDPKETKKQFALSIKDHPHKAFLFALYDKKDISEQIWDMIRPVYAKPFTEDIDT